MNRRRGILCGRAGRAAQVILPLFLLVVSESVQLFAAAGVSFTLAAVSAFCQVSSELYRTARKRHREPDPEIIA
ncbi:hypothetical protein [Actinocorallia longicatena]|uniref:Uncharacterized protein n=1 Tax=Actinocorallia longicatena TaxID=111803 RepID=A0ABP6QIX8_9ACTN